MTEAASRFDSFVIFAAMRTGSNYLEETLNLYPGIRCWGEAFNPSFIGQHNWSDILGITRAEREAAPARLLARMKEEDGTLPGFRFFHDHDPRVLELVLDDPRCAKVVLSRNPLESYISRKIAVATDQWRLTDVRDRKKTKVRFDQGEFETHLDALAGFHQRVLHALQVSGQTAFHLAYEDIGDIEILNGLARFLGVDGVLDTPSTRLKRQNPEPIAETVVNPDEMTAGLAAIDRFNLAHLPNFEPRRGPAVPTYVAAADTPLLFQPVKGGPTAVIERWLASLDRVEPEALRRQFNRQSLRAWKAENDPSRTFSVVCHPLMRAHRVFVAHVLDYGPAGFAEIRRNLRIDHGLPIPKREDAEGYTRLHYRQALAGFLRFIRANLAGQTGIRTDPGWISQIGLLQGMTEFHPPDMIIREDQLGLGLAQLCQQIGRARMPKLPDMVDAGPVTLAEIYDDELETLAREVYRHDFAAFGFGRLTPAQAA